MQQPTKVSKMEFSPIDQDRGTSPRIPQNKAIVPVSAQDLAARTLKNREENISFNRLSDPLLSSISSQDESSSSPSEEQEDPAMASQQCVQRKPDMITQRAELRRSIDALYKGISHETQPTKEEVKVIIKGN